MPLVVDGMALEHRWFDPPEVEGDPPLVLLHEGLGSLSAWRDFPAALAAATGRRVFVYSRPGYGHSPPLPPPWPLDFMEREAKRLPKVIEQVGLERAILVGHSDGASIALLAADAARFPRLILLAPHVFVEDLTVASIAAAAQDYQSGDLRVRLAKHHQDVDATFLGWSGAWLDPGFRSWNIQRCLPKVSVPTLVIQGQDDRYGTLAQVEAVREGSGGPVREAILAACGHSPHREQRAATLSAIQAFLRP